MFDAKWLEILKAAGGKTTSVALACGLYLLIAYLGWIPQLEAWVVQLVTFVLILTGALAIASTVSAANNFFQPRAWMFHRWRIRGEQQRLRDYIPHMTEHEREIVSYLLTKQQKTFEAASDGGRAATLMSRGIVRIAGQKNQHMDMNHVPMIIPDHLWKVLAEHKEQFPYTPPPRGERQPHPWRRHWME
jgi:hypothetical protein